MNINFDTDKMVLVYYPAYAGGNFVSNCLQLSKHAALKSVKANEYILDNPSDYDYRLTEIMSRLPTGKERMHTWREQNEVVQYGEEGIYTNSQYKSWFAGININDAKPILEKLSNSDLTFFYMIHGSKAEHLKGFLTIWPNARIIQLINFEKFWNIASKLKTQTIETLPKCAGDGCEEQYDRIKGAAWPDWKLFMQCGMNVDKVSSKVVLESETKEEMKQFYDWHTLTQSITYFDVDSVIFDEQLFLSAVAHLYKEFNFDDFNPSLVKTYWQKYIALHTNVL